MADSDKTYSESEHIAILTDRVSTETAALTAERDQLTGERTELQNKLDVATSAQAAAELKATEAEKALEDFKAEVTEEREAASRKDDRLTKVRASAAHLPEEFFTDEDRVTRIVAMKEDEFAGYLSDLAATSTGKPAGSGAPPRESAMQTTTPPGEAEPSAGRGFLLRKYQEA